MSKFAHGPRWAVAASLTCVLLLAAACTSGRAPAPSPGARHSESVAFGDEGERTGTGPAQEAYADRAYPRTYISHSRVVAALKAAHAIPAASTATGSLAPVGAWTELGPTTATIPDPTGSTRTTQWSGRVTSMAIDPNCTQTNCRVWVGAAGGGVWKTTNALAASPSWTPLDNGLSSNAI